MSKSKRVMMTELVRQFNDRAQLINNFGNGLELPCIGSTNPPVTAQEIIDACCYYNVMDEVLIQINFFRNRRAGA